MKNFCCLFERLFNVKFNGVFFFGIDFCVLKILTFCIMQIGNMIMSHFLLFQNA